MATYVALSSNVLGSDTSSVSFSSISQGYTDLYLRCLLRSTSATTSGADSFKLTINSGTTNYSWHSLNDFDTGYTSLTQTSTSQPSLYGLASDGYSTSGVFTFVDIWIPTYTVATAGLRQIGIDLGTVDSGSTSKSQQSKTALWYNSAAAVSSISVTTGSASNIKTGSRFYLYAQKSS